LLFSDYFSKLDNIMKNIIRNTLLITAAVTALAGGTGLASAQNANERREAPAAATPGQKAPDQKAPAAKKTQGKAVQPDSIPEKPVAPTAQGPEKGKQAPTAQAPAIESRPQTTGQGPSQSKPGMAPAPAMLSAEQHVKIRETLRGEKVEHLNNVQFSITVGEAVPRTVHLYRFPASVMTYAPQYRDYEYFMVGEEILVVDPSTLRIVAVIPA
jgi:hypothetical protein